MRDPLKCQPLSERQAYSPSVFLYSHLPLIVVLTLAFCVSIFLLLLFFFFSGPLDSYYADTFFCDDKKVKDSLERTYQQKTSKVTNDFKCIIMCRH